MVIGMKTTVDLPEELLHEAQLIARAEGTTVRSLIEAGLRSVVADRRRPSRFVLRNTTFHGDGLQPGFRDAGWEQLRDAIYPPQS